MVHSNTDEAGISSIKGPQDVKLASKLESTNNKLLYLIRKVNLLSKAQSGAASDALTQDRLIRVAERLRRVGISIEYTDGRGYIKLKANNQRGLDTLKRLNTVFPVSIIESFLDNT